MKNLVGGGNPKGGRSSAEIEYVKDEVDQVLFLLKDRVNGKDYLTVDPFEFRRDIIQNTNLQVILSDEGGIPSKIQIFSSENPDKKIILTRESDDDYNGRFSYKFELD